MGFAQYTTLHEPNVWYDRLLTSRAQGHRLPSCMGTQERQSPLFGNRFSLAGVVRSIERSLRNKARGLLARGKLDASLKLDLLPSTGTLHIDKGLVDTLLHSAEQIGAKVPASAPLSQHQPLSWLGVLSSSNTLLTHLETAVIKLFDEALQQVLAARGEGVYGLHDIIASALTSIGKKVAALEPLAAELPALQQRKLQQNIDELATKIDADRMVQEIVLLAQKADVREKLDRLKIHVEQDTPLISGPGRHGRRVDFLTQELNREANTLGAMVICSETSSASTELKVIVEQIREQVQNIE